MAELRPKAPTSPAQPSALKKAIDACHRLTLDRRQLVAPHATLRGTHLIRRMCTSPRRTGRCARRREGTACAAVAGVRQPMVAGGRRGWHLLLSSLLGRQGTRHAASDGAEGFINLLAEGVYRELKPHKHRRLGRRAGPVQSGVEARARRSGGGLPDRLARPGMREMVRHGIATRAAPSKVLPARSVRCRAIRVRAAAHFRVPGRAASARGMAMAMAAASRQAAPRLLASGDTVILALLTLLAAALTGNCTPACPRHWESRSRGRHSPTIPCRHGLGPPKAQRHDPGMVLERRSMAPTSIAQVRNPMPYGAHVLRNHRQLAVQPIPIPVSVPDNPSPPGDGGARAPAADPSVDAKGSDAVHRTTS